MNESIESKQPGFAKQALKKIRDLQKQLAEHTTATNEPIAIIGVSCRFPGEVDDITSLWQLLKEQRCTVTEVPSERWSIADYYDPEPGKPQKMYSKYGSFLNRVDEFDPGFFNITPREAELMDPQQRLLLELSWEAMEHAMILPSTLKGSATAVFIGAMTQDYQQFLTTSEASDFFATTGNANSVCAGRIAYTFGFNGPTMTLDTACSSSLVAIHLACQSLRNHESDLALAGGVNLQLSPLTTVAECAGQMLSPAGLCKTFDADADGFVRGDGAGLVLLKRLSAAQREGNQILGVILGSAVNHDGASGGLTVPNGLAQEEVIRKALHSANVSPLSVSYVEAHGTGTSLGDPIELRALQAVYGQDRDRQSPLMVGSIKTNIGHTEAAAGMAGLLKLIAALQANQIPASLHLKKPNPQILWDDIAISVPTQLVDWFGDHKIAGVSSFGLSGTNAHLIVQQAPAPTVERVDFPNTGFLLAVSAKSAGALVEKIAAYRECLLKYPNEYYLRFCATAALTREHFHYRHCFYATSPDGLREQIHQSCTTSEAAENRVAFIFSDDPLDLAAFYKPLYSTLTIYKEHVDYCRSQLDPYPPIIQTKADLFCFQYALAQVWLSFGVKPDAVWGTGVGAITAACISGAMTLAEAIVSVTTGHIAVLSEGSREREIELVQTDDIAHAEQAFIAADISIAVAMGNQSFGGSMHWVIAEGTIDSLLQGLSNLYQMGCEINWRAYFGEEPFAPLTLPYYPFQRQSYWVTTKTLTSHFVNQPQKISNFNPGLITAHTKQTKSIKEQVQQAIATLMRIPNFLQVPLTQPLQHWGMNSLMSVELQKKLTDHFAIKFPTTLIFDFPTVEHIASFIETQLNGVSSASEEESSLRVIQSEDIAIIGMACRFPGMAKDLSGYWQVLENGMECTTDGLANRWSCQELYHENPDALGCSYSFRAGLLENVAQFDAGFFDISPREARMMDPQQRITLEVAWHALEHAGYVGNALPTETTGIFMGIAPNEYARLCQADSMVDNSDAGFMPTGNSLNAIPGRVAYSLGLEGPCLAIDTACSSSLVSIHTACQSLQTGECDMALAGGVNLLLDPLVFIPLAKAGMLSVSGHCHTFSEQADGFVRAEGCGVIVLKRLSNATEANDHILAVIKGTAVNQDGRSSSLTAPNGLAQQKVMRTALQRSKLNPTAIQWVEAHGTGTPLGDPIEVRSLAAVYTSERDPSEPLYISSVKTNLGHPEAAAGVASVMKIVLAMQHGYIPRHLHLENLNPHIDVDLSRIIIPTHHTEWPLTALGTRYAAASSFGFTGTNAHIILKEAPVRQEESKLNQSQVLTISAKTAGALTMLAQSYQQQLRCLSERQFSNVCYSSNISRAHFDYRLAFAGRDLKTINQQLEQWLKQPKSIVNKGKLAFIFSGHGTHYIQMGKEYYQRYAEFKQTLDECALQFAAYLEQPLLSAIWGENTTQLATITYSQAAIFSIQVALLHFWRSLGVKADVILGHGLGEYAAAYAAGIWDLQTAVRLIAKQSQLLKNLSDMGSMLTVYTSLAGVEAYLAACEGISIAAINAPEQIIVSGSKVQMHQLMQTLDGDTIRYMPVNAGFAFHSELIDPILAEFAIEARELSYQQPQTTIISSMNAADNTDMGVADYWVNQLRQTVCFDAAMETLCNQGVGFMLEIGATNTLCNIVKQKNVRCVASMSRQADEDQQASIAIAALYQAGCNIRWLTQNISRIHLPLYPFERSIYWPSVKQASTEMWQNWFYQINWQKQPLHAAAMLTNHDKVIATSRMEEDLNRYYEGIAELESLSRDYVMNALINLSASQRIDRSEGSSEWYLDPIGIIPHYQALFVQLLNALTKNNELSRPLASRDVGATVLRLQQNYPEIRAELNLLTRCGPVLADLLTGKIEALQLLFMDGEARLVEDIYHNSPGQQALNKQLATVISTLLQGLPAHTTLRILEIGAGTGGTTSYVLPLLPADRVHYVYTDISSTLLEAAKSKFNTYPFIDYQLFDIEKDWQQQGLVAHSFDLVLAANVIHATSDVTASLQVIKQLLVPKGRLLLVEAMHHFTWLALTFGLTPGWWRFNDKGLRQDCPLLSCQQWLALLSKTNFSEAAAISTEAKPLQAVLLATADDISTDMVIPWLIFADGQGFAKRTSDELRKQNIPVYWVTRGSSFQRVDDKHFVIRADLLADYQQLLHDLDLKKSDLNILHCWSLDGAAACDLDETSLKNMSQLSFASAFYIARTFTSQPGCKLWGVTQQALAVDSMDELSGFAQAGLWGAGKSIQSEYPSFWGGFIDIDPFTDPIQLINEITSASGEEQIAYRNGQRHVARLVKTEIEPDQLKKIHGDAFYLITGGLGGLGLKTCQWLVNQGARHVILLGRHAAKDEALKIIEVCKKQGAQITTLQVDVAVRKDVEKVFQWLAQSPSLPLKGVFHAAGVGGHEAIQDIQDSELDITLKPKLLGGWWLHQYTATMNLDFFVAYSSMVAIWGSKAQARYVVANQWLDSLIQYRRSKGLSGLTINWGPWKGEGMLIAEGERLAKQTGITSLPSTIAMNALERLLNSSKVQILFADIDWPVLLEAYQLRTKRKLFANLSSQQVGKKQPIAAKNISMIQHFEQYPIAERFNVLAEWLKQEIAQITGFSAVELLDPEQGFFSLGMESLMAIQLKNRLNQALDIDISSTVIFNYPSVAKLARYLADEVLGWKEGWEGADDDIDLLIEKELALLAELSGEA